MRGLEAEVVRVYVLLREAVRLAVPDDDGAPVLLDVPLLLAVPDDDGAPVLLDVPLLLAVPDDDGALDRLTVREGDADVEGKSCTPRRKTNTSPAAASQDVNTPPIRPLDGIRSVTFARMKQGALDRPRSRSRLSNT